MNEQPASSRLRILFLGSGAFGLPTLDAIAKRHDLVGVVTKPDKPAGRGMKLTPSPVGEWAGTHIDAGRVFKPDNINERTVVESLRALGADAWVVIAYGQKLGHALLDGIFAINQHASLLPRWRGAAPINHAIWAGDAETGNSVITLADRMDAGLVLAQSHRDIDPLVTTGELHDLLAQDGPAIVLRVLDDFAHDRVDAKVQDESLVTHARKLAKADGAIDPAWPAERIRRTVHALTPWPGVGVTLDGVPMKLLRVQDLPRNPESADAEPGALTDPRDGVIACGQRSALRLLKVQPLGKRAMRWDEYASGKRFSDSPRLEVAPC